MSELFKQVWEKWEKQFEEINRGCSIAAESARGRGRNSVADTAKTEKEYLKRKMEKVRKDNAGLLSVLESKESRIKELEESARVTVQRALHRAAGRKIDEAAFLRAELDKTREENKDLTLLVKSYEEMIVEKEKNISSLYGNFNDVKRINHMLMSELRHIKTRERAGVEKEKKHPVLGWLKKSLVEL